MVEVGEYVLKGSDVYQIMDVSERSIGGLPPEEYLVLDEAFSTKRSHCTAYVPVHKADMTIKPVPSQKEVEVLLKDSDKEEQIRWKDNRNERINEARDIIASGNLTDVIKLEKLYRRRAVENADRALSGKDKELASRGYDLITHVTAASYRITPEKASEMVERYL